MECEQGKLSIISFLLVFKILCINYLNGDDETASATIDSPTTEYDEAFSIDREMESYEETTTNILETTRNILLIFNAGTILMAFPIYDVQFPIKPVRRGLFADKYGHRYKPIRNVTKVLHSLKDKGFRLFAVLNVILSDDPWKVYTNLPYRKGVEDIFKIFGWTEIFEEIIDHKNEINTALERIKDNTNCSFKDMLYFDNDGKYDRIVAGRFGIARCIARTGLNNKIVNQALTKYYLDTTNHSISFNV